MESDCWALSAKAAEQYDGYFAVCDTTRRGLVSRQEAAPLFERSELPDNELSLIWSLADVDGDGLLSQAEFRVAMHLTTLALQGSRLPARLPLVLERGDVLERGR